MKRCPECRRDYTDETLNYCLDDGSQLLDGPASGSDSKTAILDRESSPFATEATKFLGRDSSEQAAPATSTSMQAGGQRKVAIVAGIVAIALAGSAWGLWKYFGAKDGPGSTLQNFTLTRVTTSGRAQEADISPDGKFIVYLDMEDDGDRGLFIKQIATGDTIPIVPPTKGNVLKGTTFSRDGNHVYYLFSDRTKPTALYQVSALGGTPKKIIDKCASAVAISPDGQRFAFVRWNEPSGGSLITSRTDGSDEKVLATLDGSVEWFFNDGASWSPDGKTIAISSGITADGGDFARLLVIDTDTGAMRELGNRRWILAGRVVWMPDGKSLLFPAMERPSEISSQLWQIPYPSGEATRITNDVVGHDPTSLGITSDGKTILTATEQYRSRIEVIPATGQLDRLTKLSTVDTDVDGFLGLAALSDGRVVFSSLEGGQPDIWIMNADGSGRRRLTSDSHWDGSPTVTPDDKFILFMSNRPHGDAIPRLWRMNVDGTNLVQLVERTSTTANASPDGQWVIYSQWSIAEKSQALYRVSINGGEPTKVVTDFNVFESSYSPDGKFIGAYYSDPAITRATYGIIDADTGKLIRHFEFPNFQYEWVRWTRDGKYVSFIGAPPDPSNIWLQPVEGGDSRKLTDFKSEYIYRHEWSRDGKTLYVARGRPTSDVVLQTIAK